jgi:hypothetical protein
VDIARLELLAQQEGDNPAPKQQAERERIEGHTASNSS